MILVIDKGLESPFSQQAVGQSGPAPSTLDGPCQTTGRGY